MFFRARRKRPRDRSKIFVRPDFNPFKDRDALAIVVEAPLTALSPRPGLLATVAETVLQDDGGGHRIDRMGNVEVTNFILCFRPIAIRLPFQIRFPCPKDQESIKDSYNSDDAFNVSADHKVLYEKWLTVGLKALDHIDSDSDDDQPDDLDWPHGDTADGVEHPFVDMFSEADWLMVDTSRSCSTEKGTSTYLDVQMSAYLMEPGSHQTCGGRTPNEDVIDKTMTLFVNGPGRLPRGWWGSTTDGQVRGDRIDQAGAVAPSEFPWLVVR